MTENQKLAYRMLCDLDALLHVIAEEGDEDDRCHALAAHGLVHDAAAHLSPESSIRAIAQLEADSRRERRDARPWSSEGSTPR